MNNSLEITLLTDNDILNNRFIKSVSSTDYTNILGTSSVSNKCSYWCRDKIEHNIIHDNVTVWYYNNNNFSYISARSGDIATRPAIKFSSIEPYIYEKTSAALGNFLFKFGEYPSIIVKDDNLLSKLEELYHNHKLRKTGKVYTTDQPHVWGYDYTITQHDNFIPYEHIEYEYNGQKYIRVIDFKPLRCTTKYPNPPYWIKVGPIVWEANPESDIAVTTHAIIPNIQFNYQMYDGEELGLIWHILFKETALYKYLNTYFVKEILPEKLLSKLNSSNEIDYSKNEYNNMISKKFK